MASPLVLGGNYDLKTGVEYGGNCGSMIRGGFRLAR